MATDLINNPEPIDPASPNGAVAKDVGITELTEPTLVNGIIADVQLLVEQQVAMFRQDIRDDLRKGKQAALVLAVGGGITFVGMIQLALMLALLLNWAVPAVPLWACFGIVGGLLTPLGGVLLYVGVRKIESFDHQAVEAFKENLKWKTKPT